MSRSVRVSIDPRCARTYKDVMGMKMERMEEKKAVALRFIKTIDKKSRKEEIEELLTGGRIEDGIEMLLDEMLRFLAEMPVDKYHDYRDFRHTGLREYLIHRFLREKWNEKISRSCARVTS